MKQFLLDFKFLFAVFRTHVGGRMYVVFFLTMLAVLTESFGIALLLPLIGIIDEGFMQPDEAGRVTEVLYTVLSWVGIQESVIGILLFIGLVFVFKGLIHFTQGAYSTVLSTNLQREMMGALYKQYGTMQYQYYTRHNTGHFINVMIGQIYKLIASFFKFKGFLSVCIQTLFYLTFAFLIAWEFTLMAVGAGLVYLLIFSRLNTFIKTLSRKAADEYSTLNKKLIQSLQGFKYLSSTGQFHKVSGVVVDSIQKVTSYSRTYGILGSFIGSIKEPISMGLILAIMIIQVGIYEAALGPIFVSLIFIHRSMNKVMGLQNAWFNSIGGIGSIEMVETELASVAAAQEHTGLLIHRKLQDDIRLHDVHFSYNDEGPAVFTRLNLTIPARTTVAFTGASGSGKTTLMDMLTLLIVPQKGQLLIDGTDSKQLELLSWRSQIGYVSQDTVLFDDSVANNISLWAGDRNDPIIRARIEQAARDSNAWEFITGLPEGLGTAIGERGVKLSGGQKQRLFIARELFKNPDLLILDEATSALDVHSEQLIQQSLQNLKGTMTIIIVAHRLSSIRHADYIYYLDNGVISEQGSYEELMAREGQLARLAIE